uniref:Uncharacterized protein n=1 Tax=Rhizophora mucronata TaxID=61149 RepID=A0A2P2QSA0_RHIMU
MNFGSKQEDAPTDLLDHHTNFIFHKTKRISLDFNNDLYLSHNHDLRHFLNSKVTEPNPIGQLI